MKSAGSLAHHLAAAARRTPQGLALRFDERCWTFAELLADAAALNEGLSGSREPFILPAGSLDLARHAFACSLEKRPFWPVDRNRSIHWTETLPPAWRW